MKTIELFSQRRLQCVAILNQIITIILCDLKALPSSSYEIMII